MAETPSQQGGVVLVGSGSATPSQRLTNNQLGLRVDTSDSWIRSRTGIAERRICGDDENLIDLCHKAADQAMQMANWQPESIDLILLATSTPDDLFGSAPAVQAKLKASNAVAFDLTAACSGFLFAFITASQFLRAGTMQRVLVIGADQLTRWVNWDDRRSCVLFGDGAGALAIQRGLPEEDCFLDFKMRTDGSRGCFLNLPQEKAFSKLVDGINHQHGGYDNIQMNGQEVYKFAVREVPSILQDILQANEMTAKDIDWFLLHQANQRILDAVADRFDIPSEKVLTNLANYGNTSAATIPLMLDEAVRGGLVKPGDLIASSGFGAGLSWGAALFRWAGGN